MPAVAVAALSARSLAEAAARDGVEAVALDLYGDVDTCRAAREWLPIGDPATNTVDADRLLAALAGLARRGDLCGWIAGSGFEGRAGLLEQGASRLPLIGTAPSDIRRLRDPREFFNALRSAGIPHPPVSFTAPDSPAGWLSKDGDGFGGRQVGRGRPSRTGGAIYWQRERSGVPMSATFVANGHDAVILGFNRQLVQPQGDRPFVFSGVIGPVPVGEGVRDEIAAALRHLTAAFSIRGLGSIDFLLRADAAEVLEINPRPPASLVLYDRIGDRGPLRAHLRACVDGELPEVAHGVDGGRPSIPVRGSEIVFARAPLRLDPRGADLLAAGPRIHDLPRPGASFAAHDPLCTISAEGHDPAMLRTELARRRDALLQTLENLND